MSGRLWIFGLGLLCVASLQAEPRQWTNTEGQTITAELMGVEGTQALLLASGRQYRVELSTLTETDQQFIREWGQAQMAGDSETAGEQSSVPADWQRPELLERLDGELVHLDGRRVDDYRLENEHQLDYIAFYTSASWCPPCQAFSPKLVQEYSAMKKEYDNFEVIMISADNSKGDWEDYMKQHEMPFPSLEFSARSGAEKAARSGRKATGIPSLHIIRLSDGEVVYDGSEGYTRGLGLLRDLVAEAAVE